MGPRLKIGFHVPGEGLGSHMPCVKICRGEHTREKIAYICNPAKWSTYTDPSLSLIYLMHIGTQDNDAEEKYTPRETIVFVLSL